MIQKVRPMFANQRTRGNLPTLKFRRFVIFLYNTIVRRKEYFNGGQNNKTNNDIIKKVMPLFGVQVIVKDAIKFLLEFEDFRIHVL